jgi:hypothetical protein
MISTSAFLGSAFQACALTCVCIVVPRKRVLYVLHQQASTKQDGPTKQSKVPRIRLLRDRVARL